MNTNLNCLYKENKNLVVVLFIALLVRLLIFCRFQPWLSTVISNKILLFDALGYHNLALCIKNNFTFCGDAFRTPGYPFFVSIIYLISGNHVSHVLIVQIFLNLISIVLMYKIGKELFNKNVGFIAAFLFSIDLHHIIYIYYILTETIYTTIFLTALLFYIKAIKNNQLKYFLFAGILYGISSLIRPISQFYIYCVFAFTIIYYFKNWKNSLRFSFLLLIGYFVSVAPWCARNHNEYGHFALSNIKGYNLLFWNASYYEAKRQHKTIEEINKSFVVELEKMGWRKDANPFDKEKYDGELANKIIKANFADYLKMHLIGTVKIHLSLGTQSLTDVLHLKSNKFTEEEKYTNGVFVLIQKFFTEKRPIEIVLGLFVAVFLAIIYLFVSIGIWQMIKSKQTILMLFLLGSAGYFVLISGIISYARYRLPSIPFYILLASVGIAWWLDKKKKVNRY